MELKSLTWIFNFIISLVTIHFFARNVNEKVRSKTGPAWEKYKVKRSLGEKARVKINNRNINGHPKLSRVIITIMPTV